MKKAIVCISLLMGQVWGLSCTTPITLSEPEQSVVYPQVFLNEEGDALVTWSSWDLNGDNMMIVAATRDAEKKWSTSALSEFAKYVIGNKQFIDGQGNSFVLWWKIKEDDEGKRLDFYQFAKKEKNQAWSPIVKISGPEDGINFPAYEFDLQGNVVFLGTTDVKDPNSKTNYSIVAIDYVHRKDLKKQTELSKFAGSITERLLIRNKKGNFFALWPETNSYWREDFLTGSWLDGDFGWSPPVTILTYQEYLSRLEGKMNSKGDIVIGLEMSDRTNKMIKVMTFLDGQWSELFKLDESKNYFGCLDLYLNDEGNVAASWIKSEKGKRVSYVADKPAGQPWSSPIALSSPEKSSDKMRLFLDNQGNISAVWRTKEGNKNAVYVAEKRAGQSWSSPAILSDPSKGARGVKLSYDDHGNILAVWKVTEARKKLPYAAYKPANQPWTSPVLLSDGTNGCNEIEGIKVIPNNQGHFVVLWHRFDSGFLYGAAFSTATQEWTSSVISPEGLYCKDFDFEFNKKGQGIIAWRVMGDDDDSYIQVADLNVD